MQRIKPRDHALGGQTAFEHGAQLVGLLRGRRHLHSLDPDVRQMHQPGRLVDVGPSGKIRHAVGGAALGSADRHRHAAGDAVRGPGIDLRLIQLYPRPVRRVEAAGPLKRARGIGLGIGGLRLRWRRGLRRSLGLRLSLRGARKRQARPGRHAGHGASQARVARGDARGGMKDRRPGMQTAQSGQANHLMLLWGLRPLARRSRRSASELFRGAAATGYTLAGPTVQLPRPSQLNTP
ncbi:hypothetical protein D3C85_1159230 [compost metagenome]